MPTDRKCFIGYEKKVSFQRNTRFLGDRLVSFLKTDFFKRHFFSYPMDILLPSALFLKIVVEEKTLPLRRRSVKGADVSLSFRLLLLAREKTRIRRLLLRRLRAQFFFVDFPCSVTTLFYIRVRR